MQLTPHQVKVGKGLGRIFRDNVSYMYITQHAKDQSNTFHRYFTGERSGPA